MNLRELAAALNHVLATAPELGDLEVETEEWESGLDLKGTGSLTEDKKDLLRTCRVLWVEV